jgi:hypothetical protein
MDRRREDEPFDLRVGRGFQDVIGPDDVVPQNALPRRVDVGDAREMKTAS